MSGTSRPKYQVFISSTFTDLEEERRAVTWALLKERHIPVGMESFVAADNRGWKTIQRLIDSSDYYVVIIGGRYGTVDPATGISWTHREYRYAMAEPSSRGGRRLKILAFFRSDATTQLDKTDVSTIQQLQAFKDEVAGRHQRHIWKEAADLESELKSALSAQIREDEDDGELPPGWYRGDALPSDALLHKELVALSQENRELRARLEKLRDAQKRAPAFKIRFGLAPAEHSRRWSTVDEFEYHDELELVAPDVPLYEEVLETVEHWRDGASDEASRRRLDKVLTFLSGGLHRYAAFLSSVDSRWIHHVGIEVHNSGSQKASDMKVLIILPSGVVAAEALGRFSDILRLDFPGAALGRNGPVANLFRAGLTDPYPPPRQDIVQIHQPLVPKTRGVNLNDSDPGKLSVWANSLLHEHCLHFKLECIVVPQRKPLDPVRAEAFCEEFPGFKPPEFVARLSAGRASADS